MNPSPSVLILGSSSDIGRAIARAYATRGSRLILAARKADEAQADAADISVRANAPASGHAVDIVTSDPAVFFTQIGGVPDVVISVVGFMGDQRQSEQDAVALSIVVESNFTGPARFLSHAAEAMAARGSGTIIGISSVAGERGRQSNYVYGSAKAGFTAFLSGLRNRLAKTPVQVITVKPGFVATRMTEGMDLPARLTAQPQEVAAAILRAADKGRSVVYVKPVWALIMAIIRAIPEPIFKKLTL